MTSQQVPSPRPDFAAVEWTAWTCQVRLVLTDPEALADAEWITRTEMEEIDLACSRFRPDSELAEIERSNGRTVSISNLLEDIVGVALDAAHETRGAVDPTLGSDLIRLGYDRDLALVSDGGAAPVIAVSRRPSWREIEVGGGQITIPEGVHLDLGATAKAWAADNIAMLVSVSTGAGVLLSLGGDIAVYGPVPEGGWPVRVQDRPGGLDDAVEGPTQTVALAGGGLATSSTTSRRWQRGGISLHHILDPRTGAPVTSPWRTISATATSCLVANVATTAAFVHGQDGADWLRQQGFPSRLVSHDGDVVTINGWPAEDPA